MKSKILILWLFLMNETHDFHQNIQSFDMSAMKRGEDFFSYYEKKSRRVRFEDIP